MLLTVLIVRTPSVQAAIAPIRIGEGKAMREAGSDRCLDKPISCRCFLPKARQW